MEQLKLNVQIRDKKGSRASRRSLREGILPAVLYGKDSESVSLSINLRDLRGVVGGKLAHTVLLELQGDAAVNGRTAILKEVQLDPVTDYPIHADFIELKAGQKLHVTVPVHVSGKAPGIVAGGIVELHLRDLLVECLPKDIPTSIDIDISALEVGDSIHLSEIKLPDGVHALIDDHTAVVGIVAPKAVVAAAAAEVATPEGEKGA